MTEPQLAVGAAPAPNLAFTPEVAHDLEPIYARLSRVMPALEWPVHAPYICLLYTSPSPRD